MRGAIDQVGAVRLTDDPAFWQLDRAPPLRDFRTCAHGLLRPLPRMHAGQDEGLLF